MSTSLPQMFNRICLIIAVFFTVSFAVCSVAQEDAKESSLTNEQQLVIAAFELDLERVKALIADGTDANARLGKKYKLFLFTDKWSNRPIATSKWTPLLAVANSPRVPQPDQLMGGTNEAVTAAMKKQIQMMMDLDLVSNRNRRRVAIAKVLLAAQADLDLDDGQGETALLSSVSLKFDDLLRLLISSGASVNVADTSGMTPLHCAVLMKNVGSAKMLIEAGAKIDAKDNYGRTPKNWCQENGGWLSNENNQILRLLRIGAKKNSGG